MFRCYASSMKLHEFLSVRGQTQRAFSLSIGVTQQAVSQWLRGFSTPRPEQMQKIVEVTNGAVTPNDFLPAPPLSDEPGGLPSDCEAAG